jgi:hypothetical protein
MLEIEHGSIKYTKVMELQKSGYTEEQILEVIKQSTHTPPAEVPVSSVAAKLDQLLGEQPAKDKKSSSVAKSSAVTTTAFVVTADDTADDTEEEDDEELIEDETVGDVLKETVLIKDIGVAPSKPTIEETDVKRINVKAVLMQFFTNAKIVDNGDSTVSYNLTADQHKQFQRDCMNVK